MEEFFASPSAAVMASIWFSIRMFGALLLFPGIANGFGFVSAVSMAVATGLALGLEVSEPVAAWSSTGAIVELVKGALLGLPAALIREAAGSVGALLDAGRGQTIGAFYDPATGAAATSMERLSRSLMEATLFLLGIAPVLVWGVQASAVALPLGTAELLPERIPPLFLFAGSILAATLGAYLPFAVCYLVLDAVFALFSKILPQTMLFGELFLAKTLLGGLLLLAVAERGYHLQVWPVVLQWLEL